MEWASQRWTLPLLDRVLPWLTHLGSTVAVLLFLMSSWLLTHRPGVLYRLALLYAIQSAVAYGLKFLVQRQRPPFSLWKRTKLEIVDPAFPSVHTLCGFMMATLLAYWFPCYRVFFFIIAGMIGWTRIYLGLHYPTDVIVGGILGYGVTKLFLHWVDLKTLLN